MPKFPIRRLEKSSIDRINKELLQKCNLIMMIEKASGGVKRPIRKLLFQLDILDIPYGFHATLDNIQLIKEENIWR